MPPFLIYKYDEEIECIDGQNRLTTIRDYQEQGPPSETQPKVPFAWIRHTEDDRIEYVYYQETPAFLKWTTEMNKRYEKRGKLYRFLDKTERARFNDYGLVAQMIKTKLTPDQRKAIFNKWQNGSSISQCDALKNEDTPFCCWIVSNGIEGRLGDRIAKYLKAAKNNWLFDVYRLLQVFLSEKSTIEDCIISTIKARTGMKDPAFNAEEYMAAVIKAEKFLEAVAPLMELQKLMKISFLLTYAYLWYSKKDPVERSILEKKDFMLSFARTSLEDESHSTLNNGPKETQYKKSIPHILQLATSEISKHMPVIKTVPYKKASISVALKKQLWSQHFGELGVAKCFCCGIIGISQLEFEAGHVIPESKGGKTIIDNLRPICKGCNGMMGSTNMVDYMKEKYPSRNGI